RKADHWPPCFPRIPRFPFSVCWLRLAALFLLPIPRRLVQKNQPSRKPKGNETFPLCNILRSLRLSLPSPIFLSPIFLSHSSFGSMLICSFGNQVRNSDLALFVSE